MYLCSWKKLWHKIVKFVVENCINVTFLKIYIVEYLLSDVLNDGGTKDSNTDLLINRHKKRKLYFNLILVYGLKQ